MESSPKNLISLWVCGFLALHVRAWEVGDVKEDMLGLMLLAWGGS